MNDVACYWPVCRSARAGFRTLSPAGPLWCACGPSWRRSWAGRRSAPTQSHRPCSAGTCTARTGPALRPRSAAAAGRRGSRGAWRGRRGGQSTSRRTWVRGAVEGGTGHGSQEQGEAHGILHAVWIFIKEPASLSGLSASSLPSGSYWGELVGRNGAPPKGLQTPLI